LIFTEKIIAENDQYVQRVLELGNAVTVQVLKWTDDEIAIVYESFESSDPTENILDSFTASEEIQPIIRMNDDKDVLKNNTIASVKVKNGVYNDVLSVLKETNEVADARSFITYYFGKGVGLIKEEYEVTGENGYKAVSELYKLQ